MNYKPKTISNTPFENQVQGEDGEQRQPGLGCSLGGGHQVEDDHRHAVEQHRVDPGNLQEAVHDNSDMILVAIEESKAKMT